MVLLKMGSITGNAIKLAQKDAQRIEERFGATIDGESTHSWVLSPSTA